VGKARAVSEGRNVRGRQPEAEGEEEGNRLQGEDQIGLKVRGVLTGGAFWQKIFGEKGDQSKQKNEGRAQPKNRNPMDSELSSMPAGYIQRES